MSSIMHSESREQHALFSPSQPSWVGYSEEEFIQALKNKFRAELGTEIHEYASHQIKLGHKQTSAKNILKEVETQIFNKYYIEECNDKGEYVQRLTIHGNDLLMNLKYIPAECYESVKTFINDAVGYKMDSEKRVYYSRYFWGTTDAIKYDSASGLLRIHDLKTGIKPASFDQLAVYASLFCLEKTIKPETCQFELRIYQNDDISVDEPDSKTIREIMDIIIKRQSLINKIVRM